MWPHSYNSPDRSYRNWEGERWVDPGAEPLLVLELALSQLRNLLGEVSQVSLELAVVGEALPEWPPEDDAERL